MSESAKPVPVNCDSCGRFVGGDGYIEVACEELVEATCGPCGRDMGWPDKRKRDREGTA